jgi:hypothetical protein
MTAEDAENTFGIPAAKPNDEVIRKLTLSTLKHLKGEGGAARRGLSNFARSPSSQRQYSSF